MVEVEQDGKRFLLRSEVQGTCGTVFQAAGVAVPPTVQQSPPASRRPGARSWCHAALVDLQVLTPEEDPNKCPPAGYNPRQLWRPSRAPPFSTKPTTAFSWSGVIQTEFFSIPSG